MSTATITPPATPPTSRTATTTATPAARIRLTRRGRLVVLAVLVGLLLAAFTVGRADVSTADATATATPAAAGAGYTATTVHEGETLWAVAQRVNPGHDPRALVQRLREINQLSTGSVQAGQQLLIPTLG